MCNNAILTLVKCFWNMALIARLKDEFTLKQYFLYLDTILSWFNNNNNNNNNNEL